MDAYTPNLFADLCERPKPQLRREHQHEVVRAPVEAGKPFPRLMVHKIELMPTKDQAIYFAKACGIARHAYNWALAEWKAQYKAGGKPSEESLRRHYNAIKAEKFPWALEVTKCAPQSAIQNLGTAFARFFAGTSGYPRFKKKGVHDSFRAVNGPDKKGWDATRLSGGDDLFRSRPRIFLAGIGWVRMRERLRYRGQVIVKSVTVSRRADRWFAAILVETTDLPHARKANGTVGVDLGVKALATLSTGEVVAGPKPHGALLKRLRRLSRSLSRKKKGSANRRKAKDRLARLHARIANIRKDALHKLTTRLVLENAVIGIEDLNVRGMVKNRRLARSITDQSFGEFRRQLLYKAAWYGADVVIADQWFPSSKTCSCCGTINDALVLGVSAWSCGCGADHDRDAEP
jgi:putative transposase